MYNLSAEYYDAIYLAQKDYAKEAEQIKLLIAKYPGNGGNRLLDIACGTGLHLSHLKDDFQVEGMDISQDMLNVARRKLPGIPLYAGDMAEFSLPHTYDIIICMFGSIAYTGSVDRLEKALSCMARHLNPGGMLLIEPWQDPQSYKPNAVHMQIVDQPDLKIVRMSTSLRDGCFAVVDMHHLVGTPQGTEHFVEHHKLALFDLDEILSALTSIPFRVQYDPAAVTRRGMFIAQKIQEAA